MKISNVLLPLNGTITTSFTSTGRLRVDIYWPTAVDEKDRHFAAFFDGVDWINQDGDKVPEECAFGKILFKIAKKLDGGTVTIKE